MSDLSNLFHFFTIFNGDNMKDKIKDMESTYGNNDGTLTKGELKKAVEDNKALLELYGWDGYRDGNFDDLVDKWFAQMDTIKTNKNIKGTRYTETGAISAEEIEALSTKAENAGFINETGWVNLNNEYVEGIDDYETALTCKKFFEEYKEFYAQNEELILSLNGWDGAKDIVDCDLSTKAFLESFKTDKNVWVSTMNAIKQGLNISMTERVNDNLKLLKETQESFSCLLTQDKSFWEQVVDFAKDLWSTIKSWFTGEKETPKVQEKTVADYFNSIPDDEIEGLAELRAFINMDEEALLTYDIENIPNLKATFEKVLLRCKQLEIEDKMILGFHDVLKESADKTPEELKASVIEMIKTSIPDVYEKHSKEIDAIVSTAVNAISATDEKKWIQDIVSRIQKLYSGEMETELEITADNLPNYENIEALSKDNEDFEANKYVIDCLYELVSQEMPNLCAEYGNDIYNIIKSHELNLNDITDEQSYKTAVTTFFNSVKEDIVKFAQTNTDYTAIKSEVEDDYRWEFPTRAEGATIEYSKELPKWNVIKKADDNTRKELIKNAVIGIVKARIPESYEILKGDIFDAKFDELYKNIKFDENKTAYYRSSANMVNDLLAALKVAVQENIAAHDAAKQTPNVTFSLRLTPEVNNSSEGGNDETIYVCDGCGHEFSEETDTCPECGGHDIHQKEDVDNNGDDVVPDIDGDDNVGDTKFDKTLKDLELTDKPKIADWSNIEKPIIGDDKSGDGNNNSHVAPKVKENELTEYQKIDRFRDEI